MEIGGTVKINENGSSGSHYNANALDSLIISGGEINNNKNYGINLYVNHVLITGGTISNNSSRGLLLSASSSAAGTTAAFSGMTIDSNNGYGAYFTYYADFSMSGGTISNNRSYGLCMSGSTANPASVFSLTGGNIYNTAGVGVYISNYAKMTIENATIHHNTGNGINVENPIGLPGTFNMSSGEVSYNTGYGFLFGSSSPNYYITYNISGNTQINNNKNTAIYSYVVSPSSISGDVLIKGNRSTDNAGGLYISQGTVNISDNVTFEADTSANYAGGIYVATAGNAVISGNVRIKDCRNTTTSNSTYGGTAIYASGVLSMTGGSITGCEAATPTGTNTYGRGTVYVYGTSANVTLTNVTIRDNKASHGAAIYVYSGGKITLDADTIINNTNYYMANNPSTAYVTPATGAIHIAGGATGRLSLRDKCLINGDFYIGSKADTVYIDEALLHSDIGGFYLLAYTNTSNPSTSVTTPGTVVVSPNGTTVTDASQFLKNFTLMNANLGRGLDKGGTEDRHIMIVNQFFIDCTNPTAGSGASPYTPFNSLAQAAFLTALNTAFTTVWVSGPVFTNQTTTTIPAIKTNNVNLRRYTGFKVTAQLYPAYDSVMITVKPGQTLIIEGGDKPANTFTISGEGGSSLPDASIFKNNGTLTLRGYTDLYFNPVAENGGAVYQNGTFNLSGDVSFNVYSPNTVHLAKDKVINIPAKLNMTTPVGITVETTPDNTHIPGRVLVTGSTTDVPPGMVGLFYNEITSPYSLPIGHIVNGSTANLIFYIADRNVAVVPVYASLQGAFDAAVSSDNEEVRLYGNTPETVIVSKKLRYNARGFSVQGSFTLDSISNMQLLDDLSADTLIIRATTFSNKAQLDCNSRSVSVAKAAYLDLRLPAFAAIGEWYPVNLPFDAKVSDIRDASDTLRQVFYLQDFGIAEYSTLRRAQFGVGNQPSNPDNDWQYFKQPAMTNGTGYMVSSSGIQTLRFKAGNLNLFSTAGALLTATSGPAGNAHQGFNYVAQPLSRNAVIAGGIPAGGIVQVSEKMSSDRIGGISYVPKLVNASLVIAPYTNYYYQTDLNNTVSYNPTTNAATVRSAGTTSSDVPAYYELRICDGNPVTQYDALFVAASEYASKDSYEIGRDVIKMGTPGQGLQIWSKDFDVPLCANEALLEDGTANIPLFIHTPVAGTEYRLQLQNTVSDREQLWLCRTGKLVQNLTTSPEYIIEGTGNTTQEYSLRILNGMTANKTIKTEDIHVYVENSAIVITGLQPDDLFRVFDLSGRQYANGTAVDSKARIETGKGAYIVQINEQTYKVIVK
jgi:hypothetical protein